MDLAGGDDVCKEDPSLGKALYASVVVDQPVEGELTYRVPRGLEGKGGVVVGARVVVPLGRGNRPAAATVVTISNVPPVFVVEEKQEEIKEAEGELFDVGEVAKAGGGAAEFKEILSVEEDILPVPADLIELARWIAGYYCAPLGVTLSTMVPAAVKRGVRIPGEVWVSLGNAERGTLNAEGERECEMRNAKDEMGIKLSKKAAGVMEALKALLKEGARTEEEVLGAVGVGKAMLRKLVDKGLVKLERRLQTPGRAAGVVMGGQRVTLSKDQAAAFAELETLLEKPRFAVRLIYGVTGSGKTELYIRAIEKVVAAGKRAIVLVPEISLTPQAVKRFTQRFSRVAVLHSGLKDSERHQHWHAIASGWAQVIVGARSAVFAPASDIGLIVVDEEHDSSYKQDNTPRYHGRDVAIRRAQMLGVPVLLGSATPALESWQNAGGGTGAGNPHYGLLKLSSRPLGMLMPRVQVVDMKGQMKERRGLHILSTVLEHQLKATLERKKQAIFLLNRRGYAHYVMCPRCDWVLMCENCDTTMVVHRTKGIGDRGEGKGFGERYGKVMCHYCMTAMLLPGNCPSCQAKLTHLGQGTQRAEDELLRKFPNVRLARMDSDVMRDAADYHRTLAAFGAGDLDLLIGTQMIAKGLDFPNVQLVGVLNADLAMTVPDFRAAERTFQLICQVAGRAGRPGSADSDRGTVVVQTFQPEEPAIKHACNHDYLGFVKSELPHRAAFGYPPFGRMVRIVLSHKGHTRVKDEAAALLREIHGAVERNKLQVRWQGPQPPPMERLVEMYRVEIILFADMPGPLQRLLAILRARGALMGGQVGVSVDVDPVSMM